MSSGHLNPQYNLRWPPELRDKIAASAKEHNRSMNSDIVARLEKSFEPTVGAEDHAQILQTTLVSLLIAANKSFSEKGLEWSEIQKNLIEATEQVTKETNKNHPNLINAATTKRETD